MILIEDSHVHIKLFLVFLFKKLAPYMYTDGHKVYFLLIDEKYFYKLGHSIGFFRFLILKTYLADNVKSER